MTPHPSLTIEYILNIQKIKFFLKLHLTYGQIARSLSRLVGKLKIFS